MHDWKFLSTRRRPLNSYGSDVESSWQCEKCGKETTTDDDSQQYRPYASKDDDCDRTVIQKVMES